LGRPATKPAQFTKLRYHLLGRGPAYRVAAAAGINPTTLSHYQLGWRPIPPQHLLALAEVLDVPPDDLIGVLDDMPLETI
jgi:transcriptional regulator with XRE-family HTH domain